jgi:hypothetical protein
MSKDPGFIFYPGDYLRDTQTLSEKAQVAYDRIICEHMRNICITQQQLKFFTKRLNQEETDELMFVLSEVEGGFCIEWVADSINKRRAYSESRRQNRSPKKKKDMNNISSTYDKHMEDEDEIEDVNKKEEGFEFFWNSYHSITGKMKTDKDAALGYWKRLNKGDKEKALENIKPYCAAQSDKKFCKKARTYLSDKNFNDEFIKPHKKATTRSSHIVLEDDF